MGMAVAPAHFSFFNWSAVMAIYRLLQHSAFAPEDIAPLVAAYEDCLRALRLSDRSDPITEMLAKKIIELAQTGIRDSVHLRRLALQEIGVSGIE
jgi:hypothetical protein